jgi:hypothetical protein
MTARTSATAALCAALSLSSTATIAADEGALRLEPSTPWAIDYGDESCALRRTFASDAATVDLQIMQQAPGPYFRVSVSSDTMGLSDRAARVRFEPDDRAETPGYLLSGNVGERAAIAFTDSLQRNVLGSSRPYINWTDEERDQRENAVVALSIEGGFARDVTLGLGSMHGPMEALRTCMSDLYGSWGVDLQAHRTLLRPVRRTNGEEVADRVRRVLTVNSGRGRSALPVIVRVVVGSDGRVKRCRVHFAPWDDGLSTEICEVIAQRARYAAARDSASKPIVSYDTIELMVR